MYLAILFIVMHFIINIRCNQVPSDIPFPVTELSFDRLEYGLIPFQISHSIPGAESVTKISFQTSLVRTLGAQAFAAFPNLRNLNLEDVNLRLVDPEAFTQLPNLEVLKLNSNKLSEDMIPALSILGTSLRVLYIENNYIESLDKYDVLNLQTLENLQEFKFFSKHLFCGCDLFHLVTWIETSGIVVPDDAVCTGKFSDLNMGELKNEFPRCEYLHYPMLTNITALSCSSLYLRWEFEGYLESNESVTFTVNLKSERSAMSLQTSKKEVIVNNLSPGALYGLTVSVSINRPGYHPATSKERSVGIHEYSNDGVSFNCLYHSTHFASGLTWDLTYKIIAVLVLVFTALLIMILCVAVSSFCCKKRSALTPTRYEPRPAYGHEPRTGNAAALLAYAHLDFEGPRTSCDHLKRQILNSHGVTAVNPENVAYTSVLLTGKFGTMFEGDAVMIRRNQYHCKITAIEFSQRRLFERSGMKLTELAALNHPNVLNILGVVDTSSNGPLTLLFDHLADYLDVKTFLHQVVQGYNSFGATSPTEAKNLIISQVAAGMKYLSSKQFVHGDLSARNCVFTRNRQVKISLTGAGVDLYPYDYFQNGGRNLPIRWMSPECIQYGTCSSHSDVWSMGVLMWEVFSNGAMPYHYIADTEVVAASVISKGSLLRQPRDCPKEVWNIIRDCWIAEPISRINFETIENRLLKEVWNVSVIDNDSVADNESVNQYHTMMNRLHLTSVLGLTGEAETEDDYNVTFAANHNNMSAHFTRGNGIPTHWV
ncbi:insulin receptor-related protein-like isoform X2 [Symsagittifera roscoffensis]|uniref:insulin receptor-related protein-like isoform X2 n=1 Tax=Symsagittifera roscoffensis TaxID=84072 RepID=UPI00307B487A